MKITKSTIRNICQTAGFTFATAVPAQAALVYTMVESGGDVVMTSTGFLTNPVNVNAGTSVPDQPPAFVAVEGGVTPATGSFRSGVAPTFVTYENAIDSGPDSFGTSFTFRPATISVGDYIGLDLISSPNLVTLHTFTLNNGDDLGVGSGATWAGETFASLGVTPGSYTWTLDSRFGNDTVTLNIVPEPSSAILLAGAGLLWTFRRRR